MFESNSKIIEYFKRGAQTGELTHAYCFSGPKFTGKFDTARAIAGNLLNIPEEKLKTSPDFHFLERVLDEKSGKKKKEISVGQIRQLRQNLQNYSWSKNYKIAIIGEAETLSEEAGNALLKILEEPGEKTVFILLALSEEFLLPTIKSRCQVFNFSLDSDETIEKFLKEKNISGEKLNQIISFSAGRIELAEFLLNEEFFENYKTAWDRWQEISNSPLGKKLEIIGKFLDEKKGTATGMDELLTETDIWLSAERQKMLKQNSPNAKALIGLFNFKTELPQNANPRLALENLIINL